MATFGVLEAAKATGGVLAAGEDRLVRGVTIDSRKIPRGSLFIAVKGDRFDGHDFVRQAFEKGAAAAVVSRPGMEAPEGKALIVVDDTVAALQALAARHRARFKKLIVVAVTGSNGKTTVKEMTALAMGGKYRTLKTEGNLNNHIGAPLTLLRLNEKHEAAVVEMGMNSPGEIAALARMTRPSIGVITNIGPAHLEGLGTVAAVRRAKAELIENMPRGGKIVLNADDPNSRPLVESARRGMITFGRSPEADVSMVDTWSNGRMGTYAVIQKGSREWQVHVPLLGAHNVENALAAFAAAQAGGVAPEKIAKAIARVRPVAMRMWPERLANGVLLINDAYNANPASAGAALRAAAGAKGGGRLFFILGDMFELGKGSARAHADVGRLAVKLGVDRLYALGEMAAHAADAARKAGALSYMAKTHAALASSVARALRAGDVALVKGSRGMAMERFVELLRERIEG